MDKFQAYHSDIVDTNEDYVLLLESGEEAQFIPGSCPKEFFSLKRYREDLGKDYAKIVLLSNLDQLDAETHFTSKDKELFEQKRNCDSYDDRLQDSSR